ncbi:MAG: hypothetical protein IJ141_02645 [Lachnospiraceae bacterium]|nr:hypothetical protein [Lachnospiraceae bacterium]
MVDELTNESFQTGKAIVTVSVDLIQAIADACRKSEQGKSMSSEQKDSVLKKVVGFVTNNYKETHGSLKSFNKDGKDIAHLDVTDERTADIIKDICKKGHIPVDMKETPRADGTSSFVAFCEVKNVDQLTAILRLASEQVLEEQRAMTKEVVLYNEADEPIMSQSFVKDSDIDYDKLEKAGANAVRMEIKDSNDNVLYKDEVVFGEDIKDKVKEKAEKLNPKHKKSLKETIRDKKEQAEKRDKNRQREKTKQKSKSQNKAR